MSVERDPGDELLELAQRGFEAEAPVMAGDEARIARMAQLVQKRRLPRRDERRWRYVLQGIAAGFLLAGVAIGSIQLARPLWRSESPAPPGTVIVAPQLEPAPLPSTKDGPASVKVEPPITPAVAPPVAASIASARRPSAPAPAPALPTTTAAELFAAANRARVNGDVPGAMALARRLQTEFPRSNEAVSSHLSLGLLYLQQGQAAGALEEIRLYRRLAPGAGQAEALWGEAQALRALGRTNEERGVLEELLTRYPSSAFSGAARKRIAALP